MTKSCGGVGVASFEPARLLSVPPLTAQLIENAIDETRRRRETGGKTEKSFLSKTDTRFIISRKKNVKLINVKLFNLLPFHRLLLLLTGN